MQLRQEPQFFEMNHQLTYYECDESGHPSMSMLLSMFSMVSDAHCLFLGMDTATIQQTGGAWVITNYEGTLAKNQPTFGDQVVLGTRPLEYNRFFATREFWLRSENGQEYARVKGMFVFMNLTTRKMESIPAQLIEPFQSSQTKRIAHLRRPQDLADGKAVQADYRVRYFDIDVNHHVNNARYFDWLLAPLEREFLSQHRVATFAIQYSQEVRPHEMVTSVGHYHQGKQGLESQHQIKVGDRLCTIADFTWY